VALARGALSVKWARANRRVSSPSRQVEPRTYRTNWSVGHLIYVAVATLIAHRGSWRPREPEDIQ
jgi:hypothetical protein